MYFGFMKNGVLFYTQVSGEVVRWFPTAIYNKLNTIVLTSHFTKNNNNRV
jgi:hypothetical protein